MVSFQSLHIIIRMFILCFLGLRLVRLQVGLCLPIGNIIPGSYLVTSGLCTSICNGKWVPLLACSILVHNILSIVYIMWRQILVHSSQFSGCTLSCCLAALDMGRSDPAHLFCKICISDCKLLLGCCEGAEKDCLSLFCIT